jgi:flagellar biosynthesis/type III secretory pathway protein FliH
MVDSIQLEAARESGRLEGWKEGFPQGVKEGIQQGFQQCVQQGMQHIILRMLRQILPDIPGTTVAKLEALDSAALDDLSAALFNFHSIDDVDGWLKDR